MTIETAANAMLVDVFALNIARAAVAGDDAEIARIEAHINANYKSEGVAIVRSKVEQFIALALNESRDAVEEVEVEICSNCGEPVEVGRHFIRVAVDDYRCEREPRYLRD